MSEKPVEKKPEPIVGRLTKLSRADVAPDEFLKRFLEMAREALGAAAGSLWVYSAEARTLAAKASAMPDSGPIRAVSDEVFAKIVYRAIEQKTRVLFRGDGDGAAQDAPAPNEGPAAPAVGPGAPKAADARGAHEAGGDKQSEAALAGLSIVCVPVEIDPKTSIAVLLIRHIHDGAFSVEHVHLLQGLTAYLLIYYANLQFKLASAASARMARLADIEGDLAGAADRTRMAFILANRTREMVFFDRVFVAFPGRFSFHVAAVSGIDDAQANSAIVKNLADVVAEFARIGGDWHFTPLYLEKVEDAGFREKLTVYFEASDYKSILLTRIEDAKGLLAVIGYERRQDASYAPTDLQFLQAYAKLAAKALRRAEDFRNLPAIGAVKKLQSIKEKALGPQRHRFFVKIAAAVIVAAVLGLGRMELTVRGDCRIVPYLTTIASPRISGTVKEIAAKQGDAVRKGDTIAYLDDREVNLAIKQVQANIRQTEAGIDMFFAANDMTRWAIETKNLDILKVRLEALELQKEFTRIVSPQDGVIMTRQDLLMASLGASVQRGQPICEIADLAKLAVEVNVSERDVSLVKVGQRVNYSLSGAPGRTFTADIDRVSPMTQQVFGRNVFIAEARIASPEAVMRPGITGSAGIPAGKRPLVYVIFRSTIDWLRTTFL